MTPLARNLAVTLPLAVVLGAGLIAGCDGDSAETIVRTLTINVTGFYGPEEGREVIVEGHTGPPITRLNVRQFGDRLEAVDNHGAIYRGTIGQAADAIASFTLKGKNGVGQDVTISGTITVPVGSSDATMRGTWIEPSTYGAIAARATVPVNTPPSDGGSRTNDNGNGTSPPTNNTQIAAN